MHNYYTLQAQSVMSPTEPKSVGVHEKIVTVTGGPSPRLMRIIASSYKSKDSTSGKGKTSAGEPFSRMKTHPRQNLLSEDSGEVQRGRERGERGSDVNRQQSNEGTDM